MSIYPTLTDLCEISTPRHVEGTSLRPLLADPRSAWNSPAMTTYQFHNHAVRTEGWRQIRYADGGEELYDEQADPYEWNNLAADPRHATLKAGLARYMPTEDHPDLGRRPAPAGAAGKGSAAKASRPAPRSGTSSHTP